MTNDSLNALRDKLIDAIGRDQGWEESAVDMVDKVVMPVIYEHFAEPEYIPCMTHADEAIASMSLGQVQSGSEMNLLGSVQDSAATPIQSDNNATQNGESMGYAECVPGAAGKTSEIRDNTNTFIHWFITEGEMAANTSRPHKWILEAVDKAKCYLNPKATESPVDKDPDYTAMESWQMLPLLGTDARKWATAFCQHTYYNEFDIAVGWFANAIMAQYDADRRGIDVRCDDKALLEAIMAAYAEGRFKDDVAAVAEFKRRIRVMEPVLGKSVSLEHSAQVLHAEANDREWLPYRLYYKRLIKRVFDTVGIAYVD